MGGVVGETVRVTPLVWVAGGILSLGVLFFVIFALVSTAKRHGADARAEFPDARLVETALFFGQQSRGAAQARGNGTLVRTDSELVFKQWVVNREFRIHYRDILSVESPRSFLGKSQGVRLLCVRYQDAAGQVDAMAWRVKHLAEVERVLEQARSVVTA